MTEAFGLFVLAAIKVHTRRWWYQKLKSLCCISGDFLVFV
jgi:hypothetical protein